MHIDEAIKKIGDYISALDKELMDISETLALNTKALIVHRIQKDGIGRTYSTNKIPAYLLLLDESRLDTAQTINYVKAVAKDPDGDGMINWAEVRQAHGNQVAFVDLTFTGRMLMNLGIVRTEHEGGRYITTIGGFDDETRKKLSWNAIRYGDFFAVDSDERTILIDYLNEALLNLEKKYLG